MCKLPGLSQVFCWRNVRKLGIGLVLCMGISAPALAGDSLPALGDEIMARYQAMPFDDTFFAVARGIRYEPYQGVLRGPVATALAKGGNSVDQSLLLAELLSRKGYRVRFVQGQLQGENLHTLLRGLYPPVLPDIHAPNSFKPYVPDSDKQLDDVAADHIWLEVEQPGGEWLPLDPSFPRAKIGEAYAEAKIRYEQLPEAMYQRLRISVHEQLVNGSSRELGHVEGHVADLALQPMSFLVMAAPQLKQRPEKPMRGTVDMFGGALSGDEPEQRKAEEPVSAAPPIGMRYRRALFGAGIQQSIVDTVVLDAEPEKHLSREWLRFELFQPNGKTRVIDRNTFLKGGPGDVKGIPAAYRRYSIAISAGPLDPEVIAQHAKALARKTGLSTWQKQLDDLAREPASSDVAQRLARLEESAAMFSGHIAALSLNAEISELTRRIAVGNALTYAQTIPSITIMSLEGDGKDHFELGADLRLDEVEAWPYPGVPSRAAEYFQSARGIQGTMLEGFYVERLAGKMSGANALSLLTATSEGPGGWLVFDPGEQSQLSQITGLTPAVRQQLETALAAGREIIINARPVELAGRPRLGWWEHDRATGRVIGVMDDGRHGAMAEYSMSGTKIGLNDDMGLVIGLMVGAAGTETLLAAKVLEEGTVTEEAIAEIEKMMKRLQCLSCPKAEAKAQLKETNTLSCFDISEKTKFEQGLSPKVQFKFCENYVKGLKCATSMILGGYKSKPTLGGWTYEAKAEVKIGCEELFSPPPKKSTPADRQAPAGPTDSEPPSARE
jgi:Zn finger protein HypA/HybF involved in hydrogenase expression